MHIIVQRGSSIVAHLSLEHLGQDQKVKKTTTTETRMIASILKQDTLTLRTHTEAMF